jgi:hypothetical protein
LDHRGLVVFDEGFEWRCEGLERGREELGDEGFVGVGCDVEEGEGEEWDDEGWSANEARDGKESANVKHGNK